MVMTRRSRGRGASEDVSRIIIVVTGANSGVGLGLCHRLLASLSWPADYAIPEAEPQETAMPSSMRGRLPKPSGSGPSSPREKKPHTLTLILACRSVRKAEEAKEAIMRKHLKTLAKRESEGISTPEGWLDGLRVVIEPVDFDAVGGEAGVLAFCERLKANYPHITSLYINAGLYAATSISWLKFIWSNLTVGSFEACADGTLYTTEETGRMSADGKRGMIWGVNVLAPYILTTELASLLRQTPVTSPLAPRVMYTTSCTARLSHFDGRDLSDGQFISYDKTYCTSKYAAELLINDLDKRLNEPSISAVSDPQRDVRCISAEPGCVTTNVLAASHGGTVLLPLIMWLNSFVFAIFRFLGSRYHVRDVEDACNALLYGAFVDTEYLPPSRPGNMFKLGLRAHSFRDATVDYEEVKNWEEPRAREILATQLRACEVVRAEEKRKAGLE